MAKGFFHTLYGKNLYRPVFTQKKKMMFIRGVEGGGMERTGAEGIGKDWKGLEWYIKKLGMR